MRAAVLPCQRATRANCRVGQGHTRMPTARRRISRRSRAVRVRGRRRWPVRQTHLGQRARIPAVRLLARGRAPPVPRRGSRPFLPRAPLQTWLACRRVGVPPPVPRAPVVRTAVLRRRRCWPLPRKLFRETRAALPLTLRASAPVPAPLCVRAAWGGPLLARLDRQIFAPPGVLRPRGLRRRGPRCPVLRLARPRRRPFADGSRRRAQKRRVAPGVSRARPVRIGRRRCRPFAERRSRPGPFGAGLQPPKHPPRQVARRYSRSPPDQRPLAAPRECEAQERFQ